MQITNSKKKQHVFQVNNFYQQFLSVYLAVNFQTKAEKPLCFLITFLSR